MNLKNEIKALTSQNLNLKGKTLIVIKTTDDAASDVYIKKKKTLTEQYGGTCTIEDLSKLTPSEQVSAARSIQEVALKNVANTAIIVQFPTNPKMEEFVYTELDYRLDVDGLSNASVAKLQRAKRITDVENFYVPATAYGVYKLLSNRFSGASLHSVNVANVGRSMLVGRPLERLLEMDFRFVVNNYYSNNERNFFENDAIVLARGMSMSGYELARLADALSINSNKCIVDVTILRDESGIHGELPKTMYPAFEEQGLDFTPVPGGVGLLTTHFLLAQLANKTVQ